MQIVGNFEWDSRWCSGQPSPSERPEGWSPALFLPGPGERLGPSLRRTSQLLPRRLDRRGFPEGVKVLKLGCQRRRTPCL